MSDGMDDVRERLARNMEEHADVLARLAVPDEPARLGVPVWRAVEHRRQFFFSKQSSRRPGDEPGLWFATTPEAVAERLAIVQDAVFIAQEANELDELPVYLLRALGFQDGE